MTTPTIVNDSAPRDLERARSRERAVGRIFKGMVVSVAGWVGVMAVPVADFVFGAGQLTQEVWSIVGRTLVWLGLFVAASAGTHLMRFGGRRGVLAFASIAVAGACGLVAVAEQIETWFLDTQILRGLDTWGLAGAALFFVVAMVLLRGGAQGDDVGPPSEPT